MLKQLNTARNFQNFQKTFKTFTFCQNFRNFQKTFKTFTFCKTFKTFRKLSKLSLFTETFKTFRKLSKLSLLTKTFKTFTFCQHFQEQQQEHGTHEPNATHLGKPEGRARRWARQGRAARQARLGNLETTQKKRKAEASANTAPAGGRGDPPSALGISKTHHPPTLQQSGWTEVLRVETSRRYPL